MEPFIFFSTIIFTPPTSPSSISFSLYSSLGATVVIAARKLDQLTAVAEEIRKLGGKCDTMQINIRDPVKALEMINAIVAKHGKLTCLVVSNTLVLKTSRKIDGSYTSTELEFAPLCLAHACKRSRKGEKADYCSLTSDCFYFCFYRTMLVVSSCRQRVC